AGILADRFSKGRLIVIIKGMEVLVTLLALTAFWSGSEKFLYLTLFLMASHSALFAPAKYGIVPELVPREELSRANGLLEMLTYLAIVAGAGLAPLLAQLAGGRHAVAAGVCVFIALAGLGASLRLPATPVAATGKKLSPFVVVEVWRALRQVAKDRYLLLAVIGTAYFMFVGAFAQINLLPLGMGSLGLGREQSGYLFLAAAIGIGVGSFMAGRLSGRNVEFGVVPIGALALTVAALGIGLLPPRLGTVVPLIILLGIGAGLFIVPLQAFIQLRAPRQMLGEVLAAGAFLGWSGVLVAAALTALIPTFTLFSPTAAFTLLGLVTLLLSIITLWLLPDFLIRFIALLVMRSSYRIRVMGADNVPLEGPALLVANHVSWVDALLLMATQQRRLRFIMEREIYNQPLLRPLFRLMGVIPVSARDSKRQMADFMIASRRVLDDGYLLCIFAEGAITRNGMIREFRPGFERIVRGTNYPIIPVYIGGAWGSILSYAHGRLLARFPSLLPYPVSIIFGPPLPASSRAAEVKQAVMELSCVYFESRKSSRRPLAELFVRTARENLWRKGVADSTGLQLSYGRLLVSSLAAARRIEKFTSNEPRIGILLPPSVAGVVANLAVTLQGRVGVNLNYTASADGFASAIRQSGIRTVITSRTFLAKVDHLPQGEQTLYVEDLLDSLSLADKLLAMVKGYCLPVRLLLPSRGFSADTLATIIFSSGSTGEPKGVMLSHHNIQSNLEALRMVFRVEPSDNICSALPFFHSLGFTGTLWLPLLSGFSASYHPNPLDGASIAELAQRHRSTILLATPTFLLAYLRRGKPEAFATLRLVVTGAEKLPTRTADAFAEKFGIRPLEGYGATELSP
ncbi:MAG TPA: MFS transporter, partial [Geobacterales bacterium]|nr:MFS transporter [Geobacterales bacterium]